ncbi:tetratricopeptide repeat protein [Maricaulis parjimensis]|uniref:tetratricopeptide repeat protein n=1 Tax=Maricaulis parjimensis TaxID=144023 RepID=UPI00193A82BE|nr:tetratricopeptide repeat protein [Maricaulis parjimensis]
MRALSAAVALAAVFSSVGYAQSCDTAPQFAGHRTANGVVRAQYNAVSRGEWADAIHFGEEILASRGAPGHKVAALTNLCAAYAATGEYERAIESCDTALEMRDGAWRALNNRGAALWLSGQPDAALSAFQAAETASSGEDEVTANLALSQCVAAG